MENANPLLYALLVDGIIGGVGAVVGFLPLVMVMYFLIALLEDLRDIWPAPLSFLIRFSSGSAFRQIHHSHGDRHRAARSPESWPAVPSAMKENAVALPC